jgi:hypothetical protein
MGKEYKYEDYWPVKDPEFNLRVIEGAMEVGKDLFLIGRFGGFGGVLVCVHSDAEKAETHRQQLNNEIKGAHFSLYRLTVTLEKQ